MRNPLPAISAAGILTLSIVTVGSLAAASPIDSAQTQVTDWSARANSSHRASHRHYSRHAHHVHRTRRSAGHGFAWYFANMYRLEGHVSCATGNRIVASWYSSGTRTASGARFNPNGFTAAHRTLPLGTHVSVTNPRNGKSITVLINDRGPFTRGVTLDLARGAAFAIGMTTTQQVCML